MVSQTRKRKYPSTTKSTKKTKKTAKTTKSAKSAKSSIHPSENLVRKNTKSETTKTTKKTNTKPAKSAKTTNTKPAKTTKSAWPKSAKMGYNEVKGLAWRTMFEFGREHIEPVLDKLPVKYHSTVIGIYERAFTRLCDQYDMEAEAGIELFGEESRTNYGPRLGSKRFLKLGQ